MVAFDRGTSELASMRWCSDARFASSLEGKSPTLPTITFRRTFLPSICSKKRYTQTQWGQRFVFAWEHCARRSGTRLPSWYRLRRFLVPEVGMIEDEAESEKWPDVALT